MRIAVPDFVSSTLIPLRSPTEDENEDLSLHRIWTPFPLTGKGRDRGALEPIKQSPLPLSFPVEGKELRRPR